MNEIKKKYEVTVKDIKVSKDGYYSFSYTLKVNGKLWNNGSKDGTYSSQTPENFRRVLKGGYAHILVLQSYY